MCEDGVVAWETQQTDYPSVGVDTPEYEPRGCCPRSGLVVVHLLTTRVRYPYIRGVLLDAYRAANAANGNDPVTAWAAVVNDTPRPAPAASGPVANGELVPRLVGGDDRTDLRRACPHDRRARARPGVRVLCDCGRCRWRAAPAGARVREPARRGDAVVLRVATPTSPWPARRSSATRPTCRSPADWWNASYLDRVGRRRAGPDRPDAHFMAEARSPRPRRWSRSARTTPSRTPSSPTSG